MDLTTRCPNCGTVFQASLSDLQLRKGYIRCVQCAHIFDGYAEVVRDSSQAVPPEGASAAAPEQGVSSREEDAAADYSAALQRSVPDEPWEAPSPQVIRSGRPAHLADHSARAPEFRVGVAPWPEDGRRASSEWNEPHLGFGAGDSDDDQASASSWGQDTPVRPDAIVVEAHPAYRSTGGSAAPLLQREDPQGLWVTAVRFLSKLLLAVLVLLFIAQLVYVYRARVAQFAPSVRPWLEQACVPLHCRVPYARDIGQIVITGSALKVADSVPPAPRVSGHANAASPAPDEQHFVLQLTLRNQLRQPQEWPELVLDLKDGSGALLVRRNLSPAQYLGPTMIGQPFAARSEALVRVPLTLSGVRINGYQLDLFFP